MSDDSTRGAAYAATLTEEGIRGMSWSKKGPDTLTIAAIMGTEERITKHEPCSYLVAESDFDPSQIARDITDPRFEQCGEDGHAKYWRDYLLDSIKARWHVLSVEARLTAYLMAVEMAYFAEEEGGRG
jgi:hypothetical protein